MFTIVPKFAARFDFRLLSTYLLGAMVVLT
jgi:hypothetical protein